MLFAAVHESAIGPKRTYACAVHLSAFDPKRTSAGPTPSRALKQIGTITCVSLGGDYEATPIHTFCRWCSGGLAICFARTASSEACDRVLERPLPRRYWAGIAGVSPAKVLGISVPMSLIGRADEIIE